METRVLKLSDEVTIIHGDCRDVLPVYCDLICTDPPYGIKHPCDFLSRKRGAISESINWPKIFGDEDKFDPQWILEMKKPTILFGANYYSNKLPSSSGWLVWDKDRPHNLDQSTCELAWTNCVKGVRIFKHLWNGMFKDSERNENYHPMQKPVALFEWILSLKWIRDLNVVFDPYMGSAPLGVACIKNNKEYVGVEKSEYYFDIARKRLERELSQPRFDFDKTEFKQKNKQEILL